MYVTLYILLFKSHPVLHFVVHIFIWKRNWNVVKILFMITRYLPFIAATFSLTIQFLPHTSAVKCKTLYTTIACLSIGLFIAESILTLRTWLSVVLLSRVVATLVAALANVIIVTKLNNDYFIVVLVSQLLYQYDQLFVTFQCDSHEQLDPLFKSL
ncbi:hypothetical protein BDQ17DRAFT_1457082 [Cyathus striatus]|nr:hypothetical protein BDQ17DRAFT_1457082 [Cyathus striatus]